MKTRVCSKLLSLITASALVLGLATSTLAADTALTRGELVSKLVENLGMAAECADYAQQPSAFQDVAEGSAYEGSINLAFDKGLVGGTGNGTFSPDAKITQVEAAAMILRAAGVSGSLMQEWPSDYNDMARWSGLTEGFTYAADGAVSADVLAKLLSNRAVVAEKPVIGISWAYVDRDESVIEEYAGYKAVIQKAGGVPVELPQITCTAVGYDQIGKIQDAYIEDTGNLKLQYAEVVKSGDFSKSNVADALKEIDGVFFIGGEDISPSLFATPVPVANAGEDINATRDISDYILMDYCIETDMATLAACRGEQMMGIVSGCTFNQEMPSYYESLGIAYNHEHRMPPGTPNRTYARHDVEITVKDSHVYDVVKADTLKNVSSWHHQVIMGVEGTPLTVVAKTVTNGVEVIEAIERQDKTFVVGVQFHPENDAASALYYNDPSETLCDVDTCIGFFEALVTFAAK